MVEAASGLRWRAQGRRLRPGEVGEETRLKYRYLDLRRPGPAAALQLRSEANRIAREVLHERDFVEVESPAGARLLVAFDGIAAVQSR